MSIDKPAVQGILDKVRAEGRSSLTPSEGRVLCEAYGIPVPREGIATSASEASRLASVIGYPVVMKIVSPDILHKTEAAGVVVGVKSPAEAEQAYDNIRRNAGVYKADARITGVQVQQMLTGGQEV